ncbi:ALMA4 [Symbiodinium natans]|uniref:ALMA4 protein n=1 Tax=Symbiodinium natans TaxID=878477 RepID=A0A812RB19_9DINO|nr:ALMA4 [Symbiodinium natans]
MAMEADRSKPFCTQPSEFGYTFYDGGQSFNYTDIHCTHLCHEAGGMNKACMNEAEMSMDSPSGTFIPTFFSDVMMHSLHDTAEPSYHYVPGIESMKLAFSHNYYAVRPDDLIGGPRETLVGSSDGAATSGAPVTTVLLNHSGTILKRFEPGERISLTVEEVLMAGQAEEFGDDDSRLLLDGRYYNFEERVMRSNTPSGPQGPTLRLTGADVTIKITYTNKGYCRMEKDSPRLWVSGTSNSQVACVTVRAKRGWTQKVRNAVFNDAGAFWTRTYNGLKISFESTGVFSSFDSFALFESLTILFIWLQVPSLVIYVMAAFMLGTLSKVYSSVMHEQRGLIGTTAGIAARLLNYSSTYNDLRDDQGVTKQRMLRRFNYILAHEEDLDANEREKFVDFVYKSILSSGGMDAQTSHADMLSFCTACSSGEPLSFEILQAFFNRKKRVGLVERCFQDSSISAIQSVSQSQLNIQDEGTEDEPLKDAAAPVGPAGQSGSGSRLGNIHEENTRMQERCAEVTESLKETLKVARASAGAEWEQDGDILPNSVVSDAHNKTWSNTFGEFSLCLLVQQAGWWRAPRAEKGRDKTLKSGRPGGLTQTQGACNLGRAGSWEEGEGDGDTEHAGEWQLKLSREPSQDPQPKLWGSDFGSESNLSPWVPDANLQIESALTKRPAKLTTGQRILKAASAARRVGIRKSFAVLCIEQEVLCDDEEAAKVTVRHDAGCRHLLSVCKGVGKATLMADRLEEEALDSIRACMARIVQAADGESIVGITVDVGYLWLKHQRSLRQLFPQCLVLVTPMVQLPLIRTCFSSRGKTLLVTWEDAKAPRADVQKAREVCEVLCLSTEDEKWSSWLWGGAAPLEGTLTLELAALVQQRVLSLSSQGTVIDSILLDTALSMFTSSLRETTGLPVFDDASMKSFFSSASSLNHFSEACVLGRLEAKLQKLKSDEAGCQPPLGNLGLVRLDSYEYPPAVGDADHASTFSFQTSSRVARGLCFENAQQASQSPAVLENLKSAADELESQECFAIAGNCGFMHFYQDLIRDIVQVPVFMSALVQVPTMMAALEPEDRILILTANGASFRAAQDRLIPSGWFSSPGDSDRIVVRGCEAVPGFEAVANVEQVDTRKVQIHLSNYVKQILAEEGTTRPVKLILLECTELPHYAAELRRVSGLPVFDFVTCAEFFCQGDTSKKASSVTEEDATTRLEIYRDEVQKIGKSRKMPAQTLADGSIYEGEWVGPVRHGRGVLTLPDGSSYAGQFEHGVVHGFATYTLPTGAKYEGEWRLGKQDGEGREITAEGAIYQGQYKDDKKEGDASISYPDGSTYEGKVSDGKLHGTGKYVWSNGHSYEGEWEDDEMHGEGVYTWPTGVKFIGQYQHNLKHGTGVVHFPDGRTVEGTYEAGTRQSTSGY